MFSYVKNCSDLFDMVSVPVSKFDDAENSRVAVMILNFNGKHLLEVCLDSVMKTNFSSFDVFVIDNGSTDGSVAFLKGQYPSVKVIAFSENYGFCKAYNIAIRSIKHPFVVLLNNDTEVHSDWLVELLKPMLADENVAIVGGKLLLFHDRSIIDHAGTSITVIGGGFKTGFSLKDGDQFNRLSISAAACGASMLVKSDVFLRIGGFDELLYAYSEDLDIGWRSWLFGYTVLFVPQSVVYHMLGASWDSNFGATTSPEKVFLLHRNMLITLVKNFELSNMVVALLFHSAFSFLKVLLYLKQRLPYHSLSVLKVYSWSLFNVRVLVSKRLWVQKNRVVPDVFLKKHGLILSWMDSLRGFRRRLNLKKGARPS